MNALGNILWLILGGILVALMYYAAGILLCITIIGIPFGFQLFKLGTYALWPFGVQHFRLALSSIFPFGKDIVPRNR